MLQQTSLVSVVDKAVKNRIWKYPKRRIDQKADILTFKYDEDRDKIRLYKMVRIIAYENGVVLIIVQQ